MDDYIELLSELRAKYNCFDENEAPYYEALSLGIKAIREQTARESILNKIKAEVTARLCDVVSDYTDGYRTAIQGVLVILDKYRAESEEQK